MKKLDLNFMGVEFSVLLDEVLGRLYNNNKDEFEEMVYQVYRDELSSLSGKTVDLSDKVGEKGEWLRVCSVCGSVMCDGYYIAGKYACSDECCLKLYKGDKKQMEEDLSHFMEDCSDYYYTFWESYVYS